MKHSETAKNIHIVNDERPESRSRSFHVVRSFDTFLSFPRPSILIFPIEDKVKDLNRQNKKRSKDTVGQASEMKIRLAADLVKAYKKGDKKKCGSTVFIN